MSIAERGFPLLLAALFCSGAAGLTYQVLWLRLLSLVFGVTVYAASTVLAGFMAGLALGSLIGGRLASRAVHPLRLLAVAECAIAVTALASQVLLQWLPAWYGGVLGWIGEDFGMLTVARLASAFFVLLVPTSMMGATLPLVAASRFVREDGPASRVSAVYAANTAGAIAGALATGMHLIGGVGIAASFQVASMANLAAACVTLWLSRVESRDTPRPPVDTEPAPKPSADSRAWTTRPAPSVRGAILLVLWVSGLASLALEVIWFRILVLFIPATTYAFTTMLAAVLGGIAVGSWIAARALRRDRDWVRLLSVIQAATGIVILLSLAALAWTYGRGWRTSGQTQASVLTILPAAMLMGFSFPVALRIWARSSESTDEPSADRRHARDLGAAYAVNVGGGIVGAVLGGFVLLPRLGSRASLVVCAALYLACAVLLAWVSSNRRRALATALGAVALFAAAAQLVPDPFLATLKRRHGPQDRIVWREEGVQTTVSVHQQPDRRVLYVDGLHQANDSPEMLQIHRAIGHLPMVLHAQPVRALVIGLGGGATAGAVGQHAGTMVDVVELSDSVRKSADYFADANYNVLRLPNVRLRVDDGRNYLLRTPERYDVVTADIIQPIHAGAGLLYSVEYYKLARNVLNEGGLMLQWVGHRPETQYKLIVRSFLEAFPEATLWAGGTLLVGSQRPLVISRSAFERQRQNPKTRAALEAIGLDSFETLRAWYVAGPDALRAFVGKGELLTDDRPLIEYHRSLPVERGDIDLSRLRREPQGLRVVD